MMSNSSSLLSHLRDILILPLTVTCVIPYIIFDSNDHIRPFLSLQIAGLVIGILGLLLFFYTVFLFKTIADGTLAPWSEKKKLVVVGPYRYCRNPMISGVFFVLIGEALFFQSVTIATWAILFFIINTTYFHFSEEPGLHKRFGKQYEEYKQHVPRWIPRLKPYNLN
jgi:protein-S-isoprenylcysteine O-methyltransferase Ste14